MNSRRVLLVALMLCSTIQLWGQDSGWPYARLEGRPIAEIEVPEWANNVDLPLKLGTPLREHDVRESEMLLRSALEKVSSAYFFPAMLDVSLIVSHIQTEKKGAVKVVFTVKRLMITEDVMPGQAIDENSTWHADYRSWEYLLAGHFDKNIQSISYGLSSPRILSFHGLSFRPSVEGWSQLGFHFAITQVRPTVKLDVGFETEFYDLKLKMSVKPNPYSRVAKLECVPAGAASQLPFAQGKIFNLSFTAGCSYRLPSESLESWRIAARYAYSQQKLIFTGISNRSFVSHGFEAEAIREYPIGAGFLRVAPWADGSHTHFSSLSVRMGAAIRGYWEWAPRKNPVLTADILGSGGVALGPLPANRVFTGGSPFEPNSLEHPLESDDYIWMGPALRGYGISRFSPPLSATTLTLGGSSFTGVSTTFGLPGWSRLAFDAIEPEYRKQLDEIASNLTAVARARALANYLQTDSSSEIAIRHAQKRVTEIKNTLRNLLEHAKQFSFRPIAIYDYARIGSRDTPALDDWSAGGGLRAWFPVCVVEAVYARNGGGIPGEGRANFIVTIRARGLFRQYPF